MGAVSARRRRELARVREALAELTRREKAQAVSFGDPSAWADTFHTQRAPTASELIAQYKGLYYACAMLNSQTVASVPRRVFAQTGPGEKSIRFWRRRRPEPGELKFLAAQKAIQPGVDVEELLDHPLVALLENPNPQMSGFEFRELTQLYLELTGTAYWRVVRDGVGTPIQLWILQSQLVESLYDPKTNLIRAFKYGQGMGAREYPEKDVIDFRMPSPVNPYSAGYGPGAAAWESINLVGKDKSHVAALMDNRARPDAIVSPTNEDAGMSQDGAERLEKLLARKFRKGGQGGLLVNASPLTVSPITFSQSDMEAIARYGLNKIEILNQFLVPPALFESNKSRAELEAAIVQHARNCVQPRCRRVDERISQKLAPQFDSRLFVVSDDAAPEDVERRILSEKAELDSGQSTINEVRARKGREEVDWGNLPWMNVGLQQPMPAGIADSDIGQDVAVTEAAVLNGAQIAAATAIIQSVALGQMPRDAGLGQLVVLFNLTPAQAEQMMGAAGTPSFTATPTAPPPGTSPARPPTDEEEEEEEKAARRVLLALRRAGRTLPMDELASSVGLPLAATADAVERLREMGLVSGNGVH